MLIPKLLNPFISTFILMNHFSNKDDHFRVMAKTGNINKKFQSWSLRTQSIHVRIQFQSWSLKTQLQRRNVGDQREARTNQKIRTTRPSFPGRGGARGARGARGRGGRGQSNQALVREERASEVIEDSLYDENIDRFVVLFTFALSNSKS